jgi:hypothetical protein
VFLVSWVRPVPSGLIVKISSSPSGLSTPAPVVRWLTKTISPLAPGKAAFAGSVPNTTVSVSTPAAKAAARSSTLNAPKRSVLLIATVTLVIPLLLCGGSGSSSPVPFSSYCDSTGFGVSLMVRWSYFCNPLKSSHPP